MILQNRIIDRRHDHTTAVHANHVNLKKVLFQPRMRIYTTHKRSPSFKNLPIGSPEQHNPLMHSFVPKIRSSKSDYVIPSRVNGVVDDDELNMTYIGLGVLALGGLGYYFLF